MQRSHEIARANQIRNKKRSKESYDQGVVIRQLSVGQKVLLENMASAGVGRKLKSLFARPYEVIDIPSDVNTAILVKGKRKVYHNNLLKSA